MMFIKAAEKTITIDFSAAFLYRIYKWIPDYSINIRDAHACTLPQKRPPDISGGSFISL